MLCPSLSCTFSRTLNYVWNRRRTKGKGHKPLSICFTALYQFEAKWSRMSTWITVFLLINFERHWTIITWPHHFKSQFDPHSWHQSSWQLPMQRPIASAKGCDLQVENLESRLAFAGKSQKFCFKNMNVLRLLNLFRICSFAHLFCICPRYKCPIICSFAVSALEYLFSCFQYHSPSQNLTFATVC